MIKQKTIKCSVAAEGITLHRGVRMRIVLHPAPCDTGIVFRCFDHQGRCLDQILARYDRIGSTVLCTTLKGESVNLLTVEHLLSACSGCWIDNLWVDLHAIHDDVSSVYELPIMDGSSDAFVFLLESSGIVDQSLDKTWIKIKKPIQIQEPDGSYARLDPFEGMQFKYTIEFGAVKEMAYFDRCRQSYARDVARARTFGFINQVNDLRSRQLALGADLHNVLVFDQDFQVLSQEPKRYSNEMARHKILDAMGDLHLLGFHIIGSFDGYKSGHRMNEQLMKALMMDTQCWEYVKRSCADWPMISE